LRNVIIALIVGWSASSGAQPHPSAPAAPEPAPAPEPSILEAAPLEGGVSAERYIVGPGDRLHIEMWGLYDLAQNLDVTADGRLFVPRAGVFTAAGKSLLEVRNAVEGKLRALYPRLEASLTLTKPRTFLVHVTGAVVRPGTYPASPMTRVSAILQRAAGTLPTGSMRRIEIRRNGELLKADLTRFQLFGQVDQDPLLLDGDTVYVPSQQLTVEVSGGVRRPGRYELIGRTLDELLELAGGLAPDASRGREVRIASRNDADGFVARSVSPRDAKSTELADGDRVRVPELVEQQALVRVEGAVVGPRNPDGAVQLRVNPNARAGDPEAPVREISLSLPFVVGDGVRDLLAKAGGLEPWADGMHAYLSRRDSERVPINLVDVSTGEARDVPLAAGDTLVVPSRREQVMVSGAVQRPGFYPYAGDLRPSDYLSLAGGATRSGDAARASVLHEGVSHPLKKVKSIGPGDVITVPENRLTVGEWTSIALILGNIAIGAAALGVAATR
jgi:protein involved in polysaccharide export with SLBB domain